jgi:hypothetical protein
MPRGFNVPVDFRSISRAPILHAYAAFNRAELATQDWELTVCPSFSASAISAVLNRHRLAAVIEPAIADVWVTTVAALKDCLEVSHLVSPEFVAEFSAPDRN